MQVSAFLPMGRTIAIVTAGANTSQNDTVNLAGTGANNVFVTSTAAQAIGLAAPTVVRVNNQGTSPVFISFNLAARTAVIPVSGTPQLEFPVLPNSVETFSGLIWTPINGGLGIIVATISAGASQPIYLTFGEGV